MSRLFQGDENELGDWVNLQCALINADWRTVDGRKGNGLDPLIKYWIRPGAVIKSASQLRTQEIFEGDQVSVAVRARFGYVYSQGLRDFLKEHPEQMPYGLSVPKKNYLALL